MILIYNFLIFLINPLLFFYFQHRKKIGKEDIKNFHQRKAIYYISRPRGKLIWIHAVSVGETLSVIPLINKLCESNKVKILLTTSTVTSAKLAKERIHENAIHQFVPIDKKHYVQKFLNHFKPDLAIWVESELWPNLINQTHQKNIPMILLNARISDKSALHNFFYKIFARKLMNKFKIIMPQEQRDYNRLANMGIKHLKLVGNLKLDAPALPVDSQELTSLTKLTKDRTLFLAASTHPGEEEEIAKIHFELKKKHNNLLTIIVPRHPHRSPDIEELLKSSHLAVTIRSKNEAITKRTDIYLADTLGELGLFYSLCDVSLIGGSLVNIGGHNPIEAMKLNSIAVTGPYIKNFYDLYGNLIEAGAALKGSTNDELIKIINDLISNPEYLANISRNSQKYLKSQGSIIDKTMAEIFSFL